MVTSTVNLESVEPVYRVGNTKIYTALAIMPVLGVNSVAAVIAAAKKAQISRRERDKKLRWLFTDKEIREKLLLRPGRGRPVGSGHPNGPRKAKETVATDATSATNVTMETPNTDAAANTTSVAIAEAMDIDTDGAVQTEFYD